jgi:hypothetical protein
MRTKKCPDCVSLYLANVPDDIHEIVLRKQLDMKLKNKKANGKNLEDVIYRIIHEWHDYHNKGVVIDIGSMKIANQITQEQKIYIINEVNKRSV